MVLASGKKRRGNKANILYFLQVLFVKGEIKELKLLFENIYRKEGEKDEGKHINMNSHAFRYTPYGATNTHRSKQNVQMCTCCRPVRFRLKLDLLYNVLNKKKRIVP